ncbi:MAG: hypothetical protein J6K04_05270 [Lachnospiraceae bacterium]|nr:hypothetical protein [Lachnospiraceae bacterium]
MKDKWTWDDTKLYSKMLWFIFLDEVSKLLLSCAKIFAACGAKIALLVERMRAYNIELSKKIEIEQKQMEEKQNSSQ